MGATAVVDGRVGPVLGNPMCPGVTGTSRCDADHSRGVTSVTVLHSPTAQTCFMSGSVWRPEAAGRRVPILTSKEFRLRSFQESLLQKDGGLIDASRNNRKGG